MTATVPVIPTLPAYDTTALSGLPVRGADWAPTADALTWVRGRGGVLVPAYDPGHTLLPDDVGTASATDFHFKVYHRYPAIARVWVIGVQRSSPLVSVQVQAVTITAPAGTGTAQAINVTESTLGRSPPIVYIERLSAQVTGEQSISLRIGIGSDAGETSSFDVYEIACFELPRHSLLAADSAVDIDTLRTLQPIYDGAVGQSVGGVGDALVACEAQSARGGLWAWNVPDDYGPLTAATWADFFPAYPPAYAHEVSAVTKPCKPFVRAKCSGTATGEVRITTRLGATATISVSGTSWAFFGSGSSVALDTEDVFASDGRRGAPTSEAVRWEWRQSGGAGNLYVSGLYLLDG